MELQIIFFLGLASVVAGNDCVWNKTDSFPKYTPLMLDSNLQLILPVQEGDQNVVRVPSGTKMTLACPGGAVGTVKGDKETVQAKCIQGTELFINGSTYTLNLLGCTKRPKPDIKRNQGVCAGGLGELMYVGYPINASYFFDVFRVCFDTGNQTNLYSEHIIRGKNIGAKDIDSSRPSFKSSSGFFTVSMNNVYTKDTQLELMEKLLGDAGLAGTIIDTSSQNYFARGHMSPDADFVTEAEQDATYYYINALPQFQAFNNGNWKYLEFATRELSELLQKDLTIYSGGSGVLKYDDINNNPVDIYLGLAENETVVPAPAVTWKVVYDSKSNKAAAIVGVNDPHLTSPPTPICPGSCDDLGWIDFDVTRLNKGYTYCCSLGDLRAAVPLVPDLGNVGLLTTKGCGH